MEEIYYKQYEEQFYSHTKESINAKGKLDFEKLLQLTSSVTGLSPIPEQIREKLEYWFSRTCTLRPIEKLMDKNDIEEVILHAQDEFKQ